MRRYHAASSVASAGIPMASRMGPVMSIPTTVSRAPHTSVSMAVVCTALFTRSMRPWPIRMAIATFAPTDRPTKRPMSREMTGATPPTAARAPLLMNRPATTASAELNSCEMIDESASGTANMMILPKRGPCSMSMLLVFFGCAGVLAVSSSGEAEAVLSVVLIDAGVAFRA